MKITIIYFLILVLVSLQSSAQISFFKDIEPIIISNCYPCHDHNNAAPIEFTSLSKVIHNAKLIKQVIRSGYMPPWPADINYSRFCHERVMTEAERSKLLLWLEQEKKIEPKQNLSKVYDPGEVDYRRPDMVISMKEKFQINGSGKDNIAQFIIPISIAADTIVGEIQFLPGNLKAIHHANFSIFADSIIDKSHVKYYTQVQPLLESDLPFIDPLPNKDLLYYGGWLPGCTPLIFPKGFGIKLTKSAFLVLTIHYGPTTIDLKDQSKVLLYFSNDTVKRQLESITFGSFGRVCAVYPPLLLPPNTVQDFEIRHTMVKDFSLMYINPHMHLLGRKIRAFVILPNKDTLHLVQINDWDFRWQYFYELRQVTKIPIGAELVVQGQFDNTENNPFNPFHPPRIVKEGVMTNNEMMSLIFVGVYYEDGDEKIKMQ